MSNNTSYAPLSRSSSRPPSLGLSRRRFLTGAVALSGALWLPARMSLAAEVGGFELPADAKHAMAKSALVYMTPIKTNGRESKCHSEIWFAHHKSEVYLVTPDDAWRSQAIQQGLDRARIWLGDFGVWKKSDKWKSLPNYLARASIVAPGDPAIERCLKTMGEKYASNWGKWGPRFRKGLADGSRLVLRYQPVGS